MTLPPAAATTAPLASAAQGVVEKVAHYRWSICALLFFGTTMNYVDRQVLGLLAPAAHQGWSANLFTLASDMFPQRAVASVVGIGGFGGAVGGLFIASFTGWVLQISGSYLPMFIIAGSAYLLALEVV